VDQRDGAAESDETSAGEEDDYAETKSPRSLSVRELEVLRLVARGFSSRQIGAQLGIAQSTVDKHVASISGKLGVSSRIAASTEAVRRGIID